jgi:hypothetical protein
MKLNTAGFAALTLALAGVALAGSKFTGNGSVVIVKNADGSGNASGYLGHIYNGTGKNEYIGCQKYATGGIDCRARTEANELAFCASGSAYLGNAIGTLAPDTRLTFRFNAEGQCVGITITHSSEFQDKSS